MWVRHGDSIRSDVNSDRDLIASVRALLTPYRGPAPLTVYRGDSFHNRRRRSYGLSWTANPEVARGFANSLWCTFTGGSVVIRTDAPADTIISVPGSAEDEVIIDPRRLGHVDVIERLAQQLPLSRGFITCRRAVLPISSAAQIPTSGVTSLRRVVRQT